MEKHRIKFKTFLLIFVLLLFQFPTYLAEDVGVRTCSNSYDAKDAEKYECKTACVAKHAQDRTLDKINGYPYLMNRYGCEGRVYYGNLNSTKCDFNYSGGFTYAFRYKIFDKTTNGEIVVEKLCCWFEHCNNRAQNVKQKFLLNPKADSYRSISNAMVSSYVYFSILIFGLILMAMTIVYQFIRSFGKRVRVKLADYYDETDNLLKELSEFDEEKIIDTKLKVTGLLNIKQLSRILAQFPEEETVIRKSTTMSTESTASQRVKAKNNNQTTKKQLVVRIEKPLLSYTDGYGHDLYSVNRIVTTPRGLLYRMVEHGPFQYPFDVMELLQLFEETSYIVATEPTLMKLEAGITIIGDIRGRYMDLHRWLKLTGWPPNNKLLFLGGMIDNKEEGSLETIALICALKVRFPRHVHMIRGVPEASPFRIEDRFDPRITRTIQTAAMRMFSNLSLAATIGNSILAVSSGFSALIRNKRNFGSIQKPIQLDSSSTIEKDLIFNKPSPVVRMYRNNPDSEGQWFGERAVIRACKLTDCQVIVRSHSTVPFGYLPVWKHRLITIFSAPCYGQQYGSVLSVSPEMQVTPLIMKSHVK